MTKQDKDTIRNLKRLLRKVVQTVEAFEHAPKNSLVEHAAMLDACAI